MLICYALESRSPWFIFGFSLSCALGSTYGFLQGAWPFGLVEAVWTWWRRVAGGSHAESVRRFERRNLKRMVEIERASFGKDAWPAEAFIEYWRESPELFLIARHGRRIAGYSITRTNWRGAELESIAVDPLYRGRGVAQALLDATVARLRSGAAPSVDGEHQQRAGTALLPAIRVHPNTPGEALLRRGPRRLAHAPEPELNHHREGVAAAHGQNNKPTNRHSQIPARKCQYNAAVAVRLL